MVKQMHERHLPIFILHNRDSLPVVISMRVLHRYKHINGLKMKCASISRVRTRIGPTLWWDFKQTFLKINTLIEILCLLAWFLFIPHWYFDRKLFDSQNDRKCVCWEKKKLNWIYSFCLHKAKKLHKRIVVMDFVLKSSSSHKQVYQLK